jgi:hypothetical protein
MWALHKDVLVTYLLEENEYRKPVVPNLARPTFAKNKNYCSFPTLIFELWMHENAAIKP